MRAAASFEKVDLTSKLKFSGIAPLAERLSKETRIMVIGEFHGGTRAFSIDNLLGSAKLLTDMAGRGEAPDMLIVNGGLLPSVPIHISRRNQDRMRFLAPGVNTIEDAAVMVRPHIKRRVEALGGGKVAYVLGEEDVENMRFLKDAKIAEMKSAKAVSQRIQSLELERESLLSRLESIAQSQKVVERKLGSLASLFEGADRPQARLEREYGNAALMAKKLSKESDKVRRKIAAKDRQLAVLKDESGQLGAVRRTNTERLTPEENRLLDDEVREAYYDIPRDVFEGASSLELLDSRINVFRLNGISIGLGHNLSDASSSAKKTEMALKEYIQNKNELYRLLPPLDMLLFSHHPGTKCWSGPKEFGDDAVSVIFQQGSFADPKLISDSWNKSIRLPQTDSVNRYHFDSGITVVTANKDGSFSFDLVGHQELRKGAQEIHNKENQALRERLKGGVDAFLRKARKRSGEDESQKALERGYILSKLPSELSAAQLAERIEIALEEGAQKRRVADHIAPRKEVRPSREVKVEVFSDTHIGAGNTLDGHSNYELLEACLHDSRERGLPDILIMAGDMVEGALGSKLNEYVARDYLSQQEFMQRVEDDCGLAPAERRAAREEYLRRQNFSHPVTQVEEQVNRLHPLLRHAVEVANNGGDVILISGNHYNQSQKNENFDEATHLAKDIRLLGGFGQNDPRIHVFSGGWMGSGEVTVQGIPVFGIHKGKGSKDKITGLMDHRIDQKRQGFLYVEGHYHTPVFGKDLAGIFLSAPSIAPTIPFVDQAAIKAGLRGYTRIDLSVDDIGRHRFRAKITNVFVEQLRRHLPQLDPNYLRVLKDILKK